jgi:Na+/H+ antiporter NhaD/arsenite permease-like protein
MVTTGCIIVGLLAALMCSNIKPTALFVAAVSGLYVTGKVHQPEIISNITNTSVLTLILLMVSSLALERSSILPWLSSKVFLTGYKATIFRLGLTSAISSAFLNNTAVVATLMAGVQRNQEHPASRLLLPLSYFAILGGTLTLIGTSTNLVVNALLADYDIPELNFFTFAPVGLVLLLVVGVVIAVSVRKLGSDSATELKFEQYFIDAEVKPD